MGTWRINPCILNLDNRQGSPVSFTVWKADVRPRRTGGWVSRTANHDASRGNTTWPATADSRTNAPHTQLRLPSSSVRRNGRFHTPAELTCASSPVRPVQDTAVPAAALMTPTSAFRFHCYSAVYEVNNSGASLSHFRTLLTA